jgi:hypothetical protein
MALFKRAWVNHFTDLAYADSRHRNETVPLVIEFDDDSVAVEPMGETNNEGELAIKLRQAPNEVRMVLNLFLSAPTEMLETALAGWSGTDRRRKDGGSKRVCALLGLPIDYDVMAVVREYFRAP